MNKERFARIGNGLEKTHNSVVENAPKVLRPVAVGFGIGAAVEHNFIIVALALTAGVGSHLALKARERAAKKNKGQDSD